MSEPLLAAEDARVAIDGVVAIDRLSFVSKGDRLLIAGDTSALMAALTGVPIAAREHAAASTETSGEALVVAGRLAIAGKDVERGEHVPIIGAAPLDPPLWSRWNALEYVEWGARIGGASRSHARALAQTALQHAGLEGRAKTSLGLLALPERRVLVLAQAMVLGPDVLVAEAPLSGLDGQAAAYVLRAIASVTRNARAILSATRLDPASADGSLAREADEVLVLAGGEIAVEGAPKDLFTGARIYTLTVRSNADSFRAELASRGIDLKGGPLRFSASVPSGSSTRDLLLAARAAKASIVEMIPIIE